MAEVEREYYKTKKPSLSKKLFNLRKKYHNPGKIEQGFTRNGVILGSTLVALAVSFVAMILKKH